MQARDTFLRWSTCVTAEPLLLAHHHGLHGMNKQQLQGATPQAGKKTKKQQLQGLSPSGLKKLKTGVTSVLAKLESTNSAFLAQATAQSVEQQVRKAQAESAAAAKAAATDSTAVSKQRATGPSSGSGWKSNGSSNALLLGLIDAEELQRRQERQQRFREAALQQPAKDQTLVEARSEAGGRARGSNTSLEKEYLRLTSLPSVADVRPPQVLRQALELVKHRWLQESDYKYACDQLKSIRQDLTVQHVRTQLTLQVYETHARIAIEVGDWAEYKQCHSVLQGLYEDGVKGEQGEFVAYGLLHAAAAGTGVLIHEMKEALSEPALLDDSCVAHALAACSSYVRGDYVAYLKLYDGAPRMVPYLMDLLLEKLRHRTYGTVLAAYMPSVAVDSLQTWLGLAPGPSLKGFLREKGAVLAADKRSVEIRGSRATLLQAANSS